MNEHMNLIATENCTQLRSILLALLSACMHSFRSLSLSTATLECHQLHTWLAQCLFKLIALYDIMCCKWNRKMCYGSWNYGTFQFSFFLFASSLLSFFISLASEHFFLLKKSHIITHQKQRHILYFILRYMHRWDAQEKSQKIGKWIFFLIITQCESDNSGAEITIL